MASRRKGRVLAFQALYAWDVGSIQAEDAAGLGWLDADKRSALDEETLAFTRFLILGTIEKAAELDKKISERLQNWELGRISKVDLAILRLGAYSLLFQADIPATVTIDEAVEIAKEYGAVDSYRFVNGVLDAIRKSIGA
jgi:N utilization substance protein B